MVHTGKGNEHKLNIQEQLFIQELYNSHFKALLNRTRRLGFGDEIAEDYVQETFLIAIKRIDDIKTCRKPRAYLTKILKNVIGYNLRQTHSALRLLKKIQDQNADSPLTGTHVEELDPETLYRGAVSAEELRLLIQFYQEGKTSKEIAEASGIGIEACKKRILRAREHLRHILDESEQN